MRHLLGSGAGVHPWRQHGISRRPVPGEKSLLFHFRGGKPQREARKRAKDEIFDRELERTEKKMVDEDEAQRRAGRKVDLLT